MLKAFNSNIINDKVQSRTSTYSSLQIEAKIEQVAGRTSQEIVQANESSLLVHDKIFDFGTIGSILHIPNFAEIPDSYSATCELWFNYESGAIDWHNFDDTGIIWVDEYNYLQPEFTTGNFYSVVLRKVPGKKVYANIAYTFPTGTDTIVASE